jgi:hypothetical protein
VFQFWYYHECDTFGEYSHILIYLYQYLCKDTKKMKDFQKTNSINLLPIQFSCRIEQFPYHKQIVLMLPLSSLFNYVKHNEQLHTIISKIFYTITENIIPKSPVKIIIQTHKHTLIIQTISKFNKYGS